MSSYYNPVEGSLSQAEIARSQDIHSIQSNIQAAFEDMMIDMFGSGCVLGGEKDALKLTPIPTHVDQYNNMYDEEDSWISFYDIYLRQKIDIEKSEIASIKIEVKNSTNIQPTIFAEIRDSNFNLRKEANTVLPITGEDSTIIQFNFNLQHISTGEYYFVLRPVDISSTDLTANNDESLTTIITEDSFQIRYDVHGNYNNGLDASYNGTDYLEARLLSAEITEDDIVEVSDTNYDLCFEQIFSSGNTYVIQPASCIVAGQKVYPFDTHVSIDGPSNQGNRIDAVSLNSDGSLTVTQGLPFYGAAKESNYPTVTDGLRIAYITTYSNTQSEWICSNCGTHNIGNIGVCTNCGYSINSRIPLIEQADNDSKKTRTRDLLERVRRLEKKMDYQIDYNSPSRIKYTCEVDPILANHVIKDQDGHYVYAEDCYGMQTKTVDGQTVAVTDSNRSTGHKWGFIDQTYQIITEEPTKIYGTLSAWDVYMPETKPSAGDIDADLNYLHIVLAAKKAEDADTVTKTKTTTKKTTDQSGKTTTKTTTTTNTWYGLSNYKIDVEIQEKNKKNKWVKKTTINNLVTNNKGAISLNLWTHVKGLKGGKDYRIITKMGDTKLTNKLKVFGKTKIKMQDVFDLDHDGKTNDTTTLEIDSGSNYDLYVYGATFLHIDNTSKRYIKQKKQSKQVEIVTSTTKTSTEQWPVDSDTIIGKENILEDRTYIDLSTGEARLRDYYSGVDETIQTINDDAKKTTHSKMHNYVIKKNTQERQSTYCMFHYNITQDCILKSFTPHIEEFKNIAKWSVVLFKNDKVFNPDTDRRTYIKKITNAKSANTIFPNLYHADWVNVPKGNKKGIKKMANHTFYPKASEGGLKLTAGTYSFLIHAKLVDNAKDGYIKIKEWSTAYPTVFGAISRVKGTSNPSQVYMEGNQRVNQTMEMDIVKQNRVYETNGTLIGPTIDTGDGSVVGVKVNANYYIPNGCSIKTYVSNNGGKTYVEAVDGVVIFNGSGHLLKWRMDFSGPGNATPTVYYDRGNRYALNLITSIHNRFIDYEDYGRQYSTPVLNANSITRTLVANANVENKFEEWEFARLWMEDSTYNSEIDICFSYVNNNYETNVESGLNQIVGKIFYSQIFAGLKLSDFSQTSIDYSDYDASVEFDENNYRFKLESEKLEHYTGGVTAVSPAVAYNNPGDSSYNYGNINDSSMDMHGFKYNYIADPIIYQDNDGNSTSTYSGMNIISDPFYKVVYNYSDQLNVDSDENNGDEYNTTTGVDAGTTSVGPQTSTEEKDEQNWCDKNPYYNANTNIIGVVFKDGLEITDNYTNISLDLKPVSNATDVRSKDLVPTAESANIPSGTLEVVFSLNKYGQIEDDNATYGKAYTITQDINVNTQEIKLTDESTETITYEKFTKVSFNLNDLYGSTIYSIGIRVKKGSNGIVDGFGIGLGRISFGGYNRFPYTPYLYTGQMTTVDGQQVPKRLGWYNLRGESPCYAFAYNGTNLYYFNKYSEKRNPVFSNSTYRPLIRGIPANNSGANQILFYLPGNLDDGDKIIGDSGSIYQTGPHDNYDLQACLGQLFAIDVDINLVPYDFIDVEYRTMQEFYSGSVGYIGNPNTERTLTADCGEIFKGDIILDLYDTRDISSSSPVQSLALPAWGKVQHYYNGNNKTVHAWFKKQTDATEIKKIVLRRENPTNRNVEQLFLLLENILFFNAETMPALGPQMQLRVYPQSMDKIANTQIRKFGCVYRIG